MYQSKLDRLTLSESRNLFISMLSVVMLIVIMLIVIMLNGILLSVIMLNVIMLNVVMLSVVMLNVIMLYILLLNVVMLSVVLPVLCHNSTVVEHSTHNPRIKGSNLATGTEREKMVLHLHPYKSL